uniref:Uncharacterized protein n=1 Tax=Salix viminalis TaxID=40686 RepID=A0A6N2LNI0_SALVM
MMIQSVVFSLSKEIKGGCNVIGGRKLDGHVKPFVPYLNKVSASVKVYLVLYCCYKAFLLPMPTSAGSVLKCGVVSSLCLILGVPAFRTKAY